MSRARFRAFAVTGLLGLAAAGTVASTSLFNGRDAASTLSAGHGGSHASTTTTSTTSTTTSTTSTTTPPTTTAPPAPAPAAPAHFSGGGSAPAPAPAPTTPPPPPPPSSFCNSGAGGLAAQIVAAMNGDRAANGVGALCVNAQLMGIAQNWANWMAANTSLTHQNLSAVIAGTPFMTMGENILDGPSGMSAASMEVAWMNSPGHRANILNGAFKAVGVGFATSADGRIWVAVDFGG